MRDAEDQREHERVEASFLVRSTMLGPPEGVPGVDVSRGGFFVQTLRFMPLNAVVTMTIRLPDGMELPVTCRVVYVRDLAAARAAVRPAGMGMELLDIAPEYRAALERLVGTSGPASRAAAASAPAAAPLVGAPRSATTPQAEQSHVAGEGSAAREDMAASAARGVGVGRTIPLPGPAGSPASSSRGAVRPAEGGAHSPAAVAAGGQAAGGRALGAGSSLAAASAPVGPVSTRAGSSGRGSSGAESSAAVASAGVAAPSGPAAGAGTGVSRASGLRTAPGAGAADPDLVGGGVAEGGSSRVPMMQRRGAAAEAAELFEDPVASISPSARSDDESGVSRRPRRRGAQARLRVLVVDDDERFRELAAEPFRRREDDVRTASDGLQALSMCLEQPPDVILSDVQMPRMDGWQMLRLIRARPSLAAVPVVFLTSLGGDSERLLGYQLGVDAYLPKPYAPDELLMRVHQIVRRARSASNNPSARSTLRGELEHVGMPSLLTFFELERKTGVLLVVGERIARLFFSDGRLRKVTVEGAPETTTSWEVLREILGWTSGQFELSAQEVECADEVQASSTELLLEYARHMDEGGEAARVVESAREIESARSVYPGPRS